MEARHKEAIRELSERHAAEIAELRARVDALGSEEQQAEIEELKSELLFMQAQEKQLADHLIDSVDLHIYGTAQYSDMESKNSAFDMRNIAFAATAEVSDRLRFLSIFELESDAESATKVEVDQGWMEYRITDGLRPRFGIVLVPFGRFNLDHFDILNDLSSRPLMTRHVVPVSWAESGMGAVGDFQLGERMELDYQAYFINGLTDKLSDTSTRDAHGNLELDNNNDKAFAGRLGLKLAPGQQVGLSVYTGEYASQDRATGFDVDWKFTMGPTEFLGEYAYIGVDDGLVQDGTLRAPSWYRGGYAQLNYHFWFDALDQTFLGRHFESPTFTAIARVGQVEIDDDGDVGLGSNRERRLTLGLNYRPTEEWAFKLEYQINDSDGERIEHGNNNGLLFSVSATF
jgi:hypothetical protein